MKNYFDLKGQVAIVTGCSTGLGVQMAKALANQGANIVAVARRENLIQEVAAEIAKEFGVETLAVKCDITDTANVDSMVDSVMQKFGRIDILINNAGTGAVAPAEDITDEQFGNEMNIDLFGSFRVARAVAKKAMIPAKYGRIINIASMYGLVGNKIAGSAPYHAAKGGVVNMTRALAAEWGKYSITVNSICPGYFYTPLTKETLDSDVFQANAKTMIPEERYGNEGELDSAAIFLASPSSSYVTGVNLPVDGGFSLTVYIDMDMPKKDAMIQVTKDMAEKMDYDERELMRDAMQNTINAYPAELAEMYKVMMDVSGMRRLVPEDNLLNIANAPAEDVSMLIITNQDKFFGATALFYPEMEKRIAEIVGGSYYVLPSSVHEMIVLPDNGTLEERELAQMVRTVNAAEVHPEEQLGNKVLYYNAAHERLSVAVDLDREKERGKER